MMGGLPKARHAFGRAGPEIGFADSLLPVVLLVAREIQHLHPL